MEPFHRHTGLAVALDRPNVDTDQIIPKEFLKRIERTGFGAYLFHDWRTEEGTREEVFPLDAARYRGASVLLAGPNFGCGSSREHAVWALQEYGFRAIIAPSFADIFQTNCLSNGLVPVRLGAEEVSTLMQCSRSTPGYRVTVDLDREMVQADGGFRAAFHLPDFARHRLLHGLDDIGLTLQHEAAIEEYERVRG